MRITRAAVFLCALAIGLTTGAANAGGPPGTCGALPGWSDLRQSLIAALRNVHAYTDNGLFAPQDVGDKRTTPCEAVIQLTASGWVRRSPSLWSCGTVVKTD